VGLRGGSAVACVVLAPLWLCTCPDALLLERLREENRFSIPAIGTSVALAITALRHLLRVRIASGWLAGMLFATRLLLLGGLAAGGVALGVLVFLRRPTPRALAVAMMGAAAVAAVLAGQVASLRWLALFVGAAYAVASGGLRLLAAVPGAIARR
jgi:hypothetical protein